MAISVLAGAVGGPATDGAAKVMKGSALFAKEISKTMVNVGISTGIGAISGIASKASVTAIQTGSWNAVKKDFNSFNDWAGIAGSAVTSAISGAVGGKMDAVQSKALSGLVSLGSSLAGKATEYGMYTLGSLHDGRGFYDAYNNMGGISVSALSAGMVLDVIGSAVGRTNSSGQSAIGEAARFFKGAGLLEVNIGTGGLTSKIGSGGMGLVEDLYDFGKRTYDFASLKKYAATHDAAQAKAAYDAYVYGDFTQENTAARLASEKDELVFVKKDGKPENFKAQTTQNGKGGRRIEMINSGDDYMNAIQLGHEAYRNGIVGSEREQKNETYRAVKGHTEMTKRMLASSTAGDAVAELVAGNTNLQKDLAASMKGGKAFREYVDETYKSDGDYWLFKLDGSIIDDGKYCFSREVINEDGKSEYEEIEGSGFSGSRVAALIKAIGFDNVVNKMINGRTWYDSTQYSTEVLKEVGLTDEQIEYARQTGEIATSSLTDSQKNQLLGELLMKENGGKWDSQTKKWNSGAKFNSQTKEWNSTTCTLKIPGLEYNDSLGVYKDDIGYHFFTAGINVDRKEKAYSVGKITSPATAYDDYANTTVTAWRKDLFTNQKDTYVLSDSNGNAVDWTSVSHHADDKTSKTVNGVEYKGNTIVSEYFKMHMWEANQHAKDKWGVIDTVGIMTDATTLKGETLRKDGRFKDGDERWLWHSMSQSGGSAGCFGPMSKNGVGDYASNNVNTGSYYMNNFWKKMKNDWGIYNGYEFNIHMTGKLRPDTK